MLRQIRGCHSRPPNSPAIQKILQINYCFVKPEAKLRLFLSDAKPLAYAVKDGCIVIVYPGYSDHRATKGVDKQEPRDKADGLIGELVLEDEETNQLKLPNGDTLAMYRVDYDEWGPEDLEPEWPLYGTEERPEPQVLLDLLTKILPETGALNADFLGDAITTWNNAGLGGSDNIIHEIDGKLLLLIRAAIDKKVMKAAEKLTMPLPLVYH
jgi:hypothetical protein